MEQQLKELSPVLGEDMETNQRILSLHTWLGHWCHRQNSGFYFGNQMAYMALGLWALDGVCLSQGGEGSLGKN